MEFFILAAAFSLCYREALIAQDTVPLGPLSGHSNSGYDGAENRWQLSAFDIDKQPDTVPYSMRTLRNAQMRPMLAADWAVENSGKTVVHFAGLPSSVEVSNEPSSSWVVANFNNYSVISLDESDHLLYTEMHFRILQVVLQPPAGTLSTSSSFDVDFEGGKSNAQPVELSPSSLFRDDSLYNPDIPTSCS